MSRSVIQFQNLVFPERIGRAAEPGALWNLAETAGRLVEISGAGTKAGLTVALGLVLEAQRRGEPVAWVTPSASAFYPPDAAKGGVDLDALAVIRVPDARAAARAADRLLRSGAFGLIVLDLGAQAGIPMPLQSCLAGLAQKHHTAVLCLTEKTRETPSLGSLVFLRVHAQRREAADHQFLCELAVLKDKRRGPTWVHTEGCRGPDGL